MRALVWIPERILMKSKARTENKIPYHEADSKVERMNLEELGEELCWCFFRQFSGFGQGSGYVAGVADLEFILSDRRRRENWISSKTTTRGKETNELLRNYFLEKLNELV
jgi:hypothetical protein